jgi:predicted RNase H-like HicB family nuclease
VIKVAPERRHVVPNADGGWDVKKPGADRASSHHDTQGEAEQRAKEILGNAGGGEAVIHDRGGKIRDKDTVPPGKDPFPPRDKRH